MTAEQTQNNDIARGSEAEIIRLIISEQFFTMRCKAVPAESGLANAVDCELPNTFIQLTSGNQKRIKKTITDVTLAYTNGAQLTFPSDGLRGILFCSNYPTREIETATVADLSCVNVTGNKSIFIPAMYEGEFATRIIQTAIELYQIKASKLVIGNGTDDIMKIESNQYAILNQLFTIISANIAGVAAGNAAAAAAIVAGCTAAINALNIDKTKIDNMSDI